MGRGNGPKVDKRMTSLAIKIDCPSCSNGIIEREDTRFISSASLVQDFVTETCNRCQGEGWLDACEGCLVPVDRDCECEG